MDNRVRGSLFKDQFVITTTPSPDIQDRLSTSALLALPYISLWVGIDARTPTKAVYALYDSEIACLRFVHGDGTFVSPERVCFRSTFKDKVPNLNRSQRLHFMELMNRSMQYLNGFQKCEGYSRESSIKERLTFICDIQKDSCPALRDPPPPEDFQDNAVPTIFLTFNSPWDFSPLGFQARIHPESDAQLTILRGQYCRNYGSEEITPNDFQQALFCLAGLMEKQLVPFVLEGQNNAKFFLPYGVTPPKPPQLLKPRRTSLDWTVDCFIARYRRFEYLFKAGYERWPNPIAWLEAELDREYYQAPPEGKPRKLVSEKGEKEPRNPPIISWETLQSLKWYTTGDYSQYPKSMLPQERQPLELHDIISPTSWKFKESPRARKDRKEKVKATKKTKMVDLTGNNIGHMNQPAVRRGFHDIHSGYTGDESELPSPLPRKRKHLEINPPQFTQQPGANENFLASEQLQHSHPFKQNKADSLTPDDDLYSVSDREEERRMKPQMMKPRQIKDEDNPLHTQAGSKGTTTKNSIVQPVQNSGGFEARRKHIYSTSSLGIDSDIEIIETPRRGLPMALKSPSQSPARVSASSNLLSHKRNFGMQDCLDVFERQYKIPRTEFDARYYERLHSPSSSPDAQQKLYPSIEVANYFGKNTPPSSSKSVNGTDRMVIDLESPEPEVQEFDAERGACGASSMISSESGHGCIDMTDDVDTISSGILSDQTISRNGELMDDLRDRMALFQVTGGSVVRRNSL